MFGFETVRYVFLGVIAIAILATAVFGDAIEHRGNALI